MPAAQVCLSIVFFLLSQVASRNILSYWWPCSHSDSAVLVALNYTGKITKWTVTSILGCPFCPVPLAFSTNLLILSLEGCISSVWLAGRACVAGCGSLCSQFCSSTAFADGVIAVHVAPAAFVTALTGCFLLTWLWSSEFSFLRNSLWFLALFLVCLRSFPFIFTSCHCLCTGWLWERFGVL